MALILSAAHTPDYGNHFGFYRTGQPQTTALTETTNQFQLGVIPPRASAELALITFGDNLVAPATAFGVGTAANLHLFGTILPADALARSGHIFENLDLAYVNKTDADVPVYLSVTDGPVTNGPGSLVAGATIGPVGFEFAFHLLIKQYQPLRVTFDQRSVVFPDA